MKKITVLFFTLVMAVFVIPATVPTIMKMSDFDGIKTEEGDAVTTGNFSEPFIISVYNTASGEILNIEFEEYIEGVVAGEMPASNNIEALKAQAVAARSYILSKVADFQGGKATDEHYGAMVCTDYMHCQAYKSLNDAKSSWDKSNAEKYENNIKKAVRQTSGEYMVYDNRVVKAYFYAISNGRTENVEEVWGSSLPYLKSVKSEEDINAEGYESQTAYPKDLFIQKLLSLNPDVKVESLADDIEKPKLTKGGSVSEIEIGGILFTGKEIRELFNLRSTSFDIVTEGDKITFNVRGYGHGVGMSQNGANAMASKGIDYKDILKHYYSGVSIVNLYKKV